MISYDGGCPVDNCYGDCDPSDNYDLDNYTTDDIEVFVKLSEKDIIHELSSFNISKLKLHLRKSKIKKLNKKSWKFW